MTNLEGQMEKAKYQLVVPLMFLSDENPEFESMKKEFLETVRKQNFIPSYATDSKMEGLRIEEIK